MGQSRSQYLALDTPSSLAPHRSITNESPSSTSIWRLPTHWTRRGRSGEELPLLMSPHASTVSLQAIVEHSASTDVDQHGRHSHEYEHFQFAQPRDVFRHVFEFLTAFELATATRVARHWHSAGHTPGLWREFDVSTSAHRIHTRFVLATLGQPRFAALTSLVLDHCTAVDHRLVIEALDRGRAGSSLHVLSMVHCFRIGLGRRLVRDSMARYIRRAHRLVKLDVYGCMDEDSVEGFVEEVLAIRPGLDLGMLFLVFTAKRAQQLQSNPTCMLEQVWTSRPCWGDIQGVLVYSCISRQDAGNYPHEVLFVCETHNEPETLLGQSVALRNDDRLRRCSLCERYLREPSQLQGSACIVCEDRGVLDQRMSWIDISDISSIDLVSTSIVRLIQRKNVPQSMTFIGDVAVGESYLNLLYIARDQGFKRALIYRVQGSDTVECAADHSFVRSGPSSEKLVRHAQLFWFHALDVWQTFALVLITVACFALIVESFQSKALIGATSSPGVEVVQSRNESTSTVHLVYLSVLTAAIVALFALCLHRFRERCQHIFRQLLVLDFLMIYLFGSYVVFALCIDALQIPIDFLTALISLWNFSALGMLAIYFRKVPAGLLRFYLAALNGLMGSIIIVTLAPPLLIVLLTIPVLLDIAAEYRQMMVASPPLLLVSSHPHVDWNHIDRYFGPDLDEEVFAMVGGSLAPRVTFRLPSNIRLRSSDFMWYSIALGIVQPSVSTLSAAIVVCLTSIAVCFWLLPYTFQVRYRALPVAFMALMLVQIFSGPFQNLIAVSMQPVIGLGRPHTF